VHRWPAACSRRRATLLSTPPLSSTATRRGAFSASQHLNASRGKASLGKAYSGKASLGKASPGKASLGKASRGKASPPKASSVSPATRAPAPVLEPTSWANELHARLAPL